MTYEIQFEIDNETFRNALKATTRFSEKRPGRITFHFDRDGLCILGAHPDNIAAVVVTLNTKILKKYKRANTKTKELKNVSQDYGLNEEKVTKIIQFADIQPKETLKIKITNKNMIIKMGRLKRTFEHINNIENHRKRIEELISNMMKDDMYAGKIPENRLRHYIREGEYAHRKLGYEGIENHTVFKKKGDKYIIDIELGTDQMTCNITEEVEGAPDNDLFNKLDIRELGQAIKSLSGLSDEYHMYITKDKPSVFTNVQHKLEQVYTEPIEFWYLLAPMITED